MSTGTKIIEFSLKLINAHSIAAPADPESISIGKDMLNGMMEAWESKNIILGTSPLKVPGDDLNEPADAFLGIVNNLAVQMGPMFGKPVSQDVKINARTGMIEIKKLFWQITVPKKIVDGNLPMGEGNNRGFDERVFFGSGQSLSDSEGQNA